MLHNRYPGPREFTDAEQPSFYGRSQDINNLLRMILLRKVTVLFGKSGTGKSSLLNAGVLPKLKATGDNEVRSVRFMVYSKKQAGTDDDPYLQKTIKDYFALPADTATFLDKIPGVKNSLWLHFKKVQLGAPQKNIVLVLDQFEEIGFYPKEEVRSFLTELNELLNFQVPPDFEQVLNKAMDENEAVLEKEEMLQLYEPVKIKVVFTIKSEKIGILHSVKNYISDILQNCYELQPLNRQQAKEAIQVPAGKIDESYYKVLPFAYEEKATDAILNYLEKSGGENNFYENRGIETAMLQIICMHIEQEFDFKDLDKDRMLSLEEMGKPEDLTKDYYEKQITRLAEDNALDEKTKNRIYEFVEEKLIQVRGEVKYREQVFLENLPPRFRVIREKALADKLVEIGLLRKENRTDERVFYELSHEKLIEPILAASLQRKIRQTKAEAAPTTNTITAMGNGEQAGTAAMPAGFVEAGDRADVSLADPNACIRKGDELTNEGHYEKALDFYTQAIRGDEKYYYAYYQRGRVLALKGDMEAAIRDFEKTLQLDPGYYVAYNEISRCYVQIADLRRSENNLVAANENYHKALLSIEKVVAAEPHADYAYNNLGLVYLRLEDAEKAVEYFDYAVTLNPEYTLAILNRGLAYNTLKHYEKAIHDFDLVIELDPDNGNAFYSKGLCCFDLAESLPAEDEARVEPLCAEGISALTESIRLNFNTDQALATRALFYEKLADYTQAYEDYSTLIYRNPNDENAWYRRGLCYLNVDNYTEAVADFTQALEIKSDHPDALFKRGFANIKLLKHEEAIVDYDKLISLNLPEPMWAFYNRGLCKYNLLNYEAALVDFDEAVRLSADNYQARHYRGLCKFAMSDYQGAILEYDKVIEYQADYERAWYNRGLCKFNLQQYDEAIADYTQAIAINNDLVDAYFERAFTYFKKGQYKEADDDFSEVVKRQKDYHQAWYNKGLCQTELKNTEVALQNFSEAIAIKPDYTNALFERGLIYFNMRDYRLSVIDFENVTKHNPEIDTAWYNAGLCHYQLQNLDAAIQAFLQVLRIDENYLDGRYQLGLCYYDQKKYQEAMECFEKVAAANPEYSGINTSLGAAYYYTGAYDKAIALFTKQIDLNENDGTAYINRADVYRRLEDFDQATRDFAKAAELSPDDPYLYANKALLILQAQKDEAAFFSELEKGVDKGYPLFRHVDEEEPFVQLMNNEQFQALVEKSKGSQRL